MPLSLPNLDDRRYADLVEEARALIPSYAPEWTNHNPSDPGVTVVELFAYLTEMLLYRVNRVTDDNKRAFLKLILGPRRELNTGHALGDEIRDVVLELRRTVRAVTAEDYERLAVEAHESVARARALPLCDLQTPRPFDQVSEGFVSVAVVLSGAADVPQVLDEVKRDLDRRKLLTTRLRVVEPRYVKLSLKATLRLKPGALERAPATRPPAKEAEAEGEPPAKQPMGVADLAAEALTDFFDPLQGGPERRGWPFGRSIYVSEIYALLDGLPGVDYVADLTPKLSVEPRAGEKAGDQGEKRQKVQDGKLYAFALEPDELVSARVEARDIKTERADVKHKFDLTKYDLPQGGR